MFVFVVLPNLGNLWQNKSMDKKELEELKEDMAKRFWEAYKMGKGNDPFYMDNTDQEVGPVIVLSPNEGKEILRLMSYAMMYEQ